MRVRCCCILLPVVCVETTAWKEARKVSAAVNDGYLAGVPLRWDSGGICFSLAFAWSAPQPRLSRQLSFVTFCSC